MSFDCKKCNSVNDSWYPIWKIDEIPAQNDISDTLKDREGVYGKFSDNAAIADMIICNLSEGSSWGAADSTNRIALMQIANKMSRLVCGDINDADGWRDIAGYATRVLEYLESGEGNVE